MSSSAYPRQPQTQPLVGHSLTAIGYPAACVVPITIRPARTPPGFRYRTIPEFLTVQ